MKKLQLSLLLIAFGTLIINSCKRTTETFQSDQLTDYMQLQSGKYITYRLDSFVIFNFGTQDTIHSYLAKDVIDTIVTDNLGRPGWRVIRYLSDTSGTDSWTPIATYMITPTRETIEVIESNMRFQKLKLPITNGFTWKGNTYIDTHSATSDVTYLDDWDYTYDSVGSPFTVLSGTIPNCITIHQRDDNTGDPTDSLVYSSRTYSEEVYGKGIGLIYKNFIYWQYQPPNGGNATGSKKGYGIKLDMIDHN